MKIFRYHIKLLDPLFYAREGLSAAFTPPYLHATAINCAITASLNLSPEEQPFLTTGSQKNEPSYSSSLIHETFYFSPARLASDKKYFTEITKGENDGYVFTTKAGEQLQATVLNYIAPETIFTGFCMVKKDISLPLLIRLGSFRGKASITYRETEYRGRKQETTTIHHPVDPLVSEVKRGIMINMFPYPIIENAVCDEYVKVKIPGERFQYSIAVPEPWLEHLK